MRPTLRQLQYLVALSDTGKFGDAAKRVGVSQPSLSTQISDVENELGAQLVERGRHGALLTPDGQEVVRRARQILAEVESLKSALKSSKNSLSGQLRLGVIPSVGPYLLPSATKQLHQLFPDLRLNVREEKTADLDRQLRDGKIDVMISTLDEHPDFRHVELLQEDLWICVPPDSLLSQSKKDISLAELAGYPLLSLGPGHNLNFSIHELAKASGAYVSSEYEGTSLDAIRQMAAMGAGVAVLPSLYALLEAQRDSQLIVRKIDHGNTSRKIGLIWRYSSPLSDSFEKLAGVIKNVAKELLS